MNYLKEAQLQSPTLTQFGPDAETLPTTDFPLWQRRASQKEATTLKALPHPTAASEGLTLPTKPFLFSPSRGLGNAGYLPAAAYVQPSLDSHDPYHYHNTTCPGGRPAAAAWAPFLESLEHS